jgi:hypothetical protein
MGVPSWSHWYWTVPLQPTTALVVASKVADAPAQMALADCVAAAVTEVTVTAIGVASRAVHAGSAEQVTETSKT